jgi:hypothetical protein
MRVGVASRRGVIGAVGVALVLLVGCSSTSSTSPSTTGATTSLGAGSAPPGTGSDGTQPGGPPGSTPPGGSGTGGKVIVFNGQGNNLDAYEPSPPFTTQRVNAAFTAEKPQPSNPDGTDINAQICFFPDGSNRFIAGEDKNQGKGDLQGWGIFKLSGSTVGDLKIEETAKLVPTYQAADDNAENYGCGFLKDGRVLTTDIGDQALGPANGQLIVWFPPFDSHEVRYCKLDVTIATAQSILVDADDNVFVASARPAPQPDATASGVFKYSGPFPTSNDASGGCGKKDGTGAPMADTVIRTKVLSPGEHGVLSPAGLARSPKGGFYLSSVASGVINEYDSSWTFVRTILEPPPGETLGASSYSTGTPLGIGVAPDGTIYFADIGVVVDPKNGIGPGDKTGKVRRITFTDGKPNPPETLATGLDYPDGIGIWVGP